MFNYVVADVIIRGVIFDTDFLAIFLGGFLGSKHWWDLGLLIV